MKKSLPLSIPVAESAPGLFIADSSSKGQAAVVNEDGAGLNSASRPASSGSIVTPDAMGEGQTTPQGVDGRVPSARSFRSSLASTAPVRESFIQEEQADCWLELFKFLWPGDAPGRPAILMILKIGIAFGQSGIALAIQQKTFHFSRTRPRRRPAGRAHARARNSKKCTAISFISPAVNRGAIQK